MEQLRRSIQEFDNDIENNYLRCIPEMKKFNHKADGGREKYMKARTALRKSWKKVMEMVQEEKSAMQDTLLEAAKTIHKGTLGLRDDSFEKSRWMMPY